MSSLSGWFGEDDMFYLLLDDTSALQLKDALESRYGRQSSEDLFWQMVAEDGIHCRYS